MPLRPSLRMSPMSPSGFFFVSLLVVLLSTPLRASIPPTPTPRMLLLAGAYAGPATIIAVGERTTILRSSDSAGTWRPIAVPANLSAALTGITVAPDALNGWAVGHDALILATSDAGLTWRKSWQGNDLTASFVDVLALDDRHVLAIGANGLCLETRDAGATWQRRKLIDDDLHLNRLTRGPTGTLYIAGERGTLLRSVDSGATWQPIDSPYDGSFYGIIPLGPTALVAHGLRGRIYRSSDDGRVWELVPLADRVLLAAAIKLKNNQLLFAGQARAFFTSRDGARSVAPLRVPFTSAVAALLELPDGRILALGEGGATVFDIPATPPTP